MRWHPLGHAMALAEVDGLRLLFDPLLADRHHGGVFEVVPPRELHDELLEPDFIFISHRHPDHFDLASLRRLAARDPDSVIITPDGLVARSCERLGFRTVRCVPPSTRIELDTVTVVTTPSRANDTPVHPEAIEWGVAIKSSAGIAWNLVDTVHRDVADLMATLDGLEAALASKLALALVPWCPLLEIEAFTAGRIGFPFARYASLLDQAGALALRGATIVPSSAGARHVASSINALVYPLEEPRFLQDLQAHLLASTTTNLAACVSPRSHPSGIGGTFDLTTNITFTPNSPYVTPLPFVDDRDFAPLSIPPLTDPNRDGRDESKMRAQVDAWVPVLARSMRSHRRMLLEVVYPTTRDVWSIHRGAMTRSHDPSWDVRNSVAGSLLCDVLDGRRHWGDLLLGGHLRACSRAYDVSERGLVRARVSPIFLYEALSYSVSIERAVEHELRTMTP